MNGAHVYEGDWRKHRALPSYPTFGRTLERSHSSAVSLVSTYLQAFNFSLKYPLECDKSFTRSDALAKHMRLQHNISPPAPGRGGSRKRKRGEDQGTSTPVASAVMTSSSLPNTTCSDTFKVDPHTSSEHVDGAGNDGNHEKNKAGTNGRQRRHARTSQLQPQHTPSPDAQGDEEEDGYTSSASDILPVHLQEKLDESTGLIMGYTPTKVMYLLMKAKHQYALQQHELLLEQLRATKLEMRREKGEKEGALDDLLQRMLGCATGLLFLFTPR